MLTAVLVYSPAEAATYVTLASKDTYTDEAAAGTNYTNSVDLLLSADAGARKRTYLQFNLPSIPATEEVQSAKVRFWVRDNARSPLNAYRVTANWTASAVTWNAPPSINTTVRGTFTPDVNGGFGDLDITALARDWLKGGAINYGLAVIPESSSAVNFQSTNGTPDNQDPQLIITTVTKPQLELTEASQVVSDPFRGTTTPKRIPGAVLHFVLTLVNKAAGSTDSGTLSIRREVPPLTSLFVGDLGAVGSGPLIFAQGAPASGLTYTFSGLSSNTDDLAFSSDGGGSFGYTPAPDAGGYDASVTHILLTPKGAVAPSSASGQPSFTATMRVLAR